MKNSPAWLLATVFGCGLSPIAPGTAGSVAGVAAAWAVTRIEGVQPFYLLILALGLTPLAIWSAEVTARALGKKDPRYVVIDEVVGQWVTLAGATRLNWKSFVLGFALFRVLDVWKPAPVRGLERLPGGQGIVADDLMAGLYGALVLFTMGWFNLY